MTDSVDPGEAAHESRLSGIYAVCKFSQTKCAADNILFLLFDLFFFFCFFVFVILYLFVNSAKQNVQQTTFHFNTLSFEENKARFFM